MLHRINQFRDRRDREINSATSQVQSADLMYAAEAIDTYRPHSNRLDTRTYRFGRGKVVGMRVRKTMGFKTGADVQLEDGQWFNAIDTYTSTNKPIYAGNSIGAFDENGLGYNVVELDIADVKLPLVAELTKRLVKEQETLAQKQADGEWNHISYTASTIERLSGWLNTLESMDRMVRDLAAELEENFDYDQASYYPSIDHELLFKLSPHVELLGPWQQLALKVMEYNSRNREARSYDSTQSFNLASHMGYPRLQAKYLLDQVEQAKAELAAI